MMSYNSGIVISEYTWTMRFLYPAIFKRGPLANFDGTILCSPMSLAMSLYLSGLAPGIRERIWFPISITASRAWWRSKKEIRKLSFFCLNSSNGVSLNRLRLWRDSSIKKISFSSFFLFKGSELFIAAIEVPHCTDAEQARSPYIPWQLALRSWHETEGRFRRGLCHV